MKELDFIKIIQKETNSPYLGDDCAYLKEIGIVVTQDNFVENIHFKREWATPYQIGYKAAVVNISDVLASGAKPEYISVALSLPTDISESYFKELYRGIVAGAHGATVIGGDITGSEKICISITAIGKTDNRKISSRKNAKKDYVIITKGEYGKSSAGLCELEKSGTNYDLIEAHLEPKIDVDFSEDISTKIKVDYAMMDTSDGLADALFQIAKSSNVKIVCDYIDGMFGAEDYNLVAAVPKDFAVTLNNVDIIGYVSSFDGSYLDIGGKKYKNYDELGLYNHFKE